MSRRVPSSERYWRDSLRQPSSLPQTTETTEVRRNYIHAPSIGSIFANTTTESESANAETMSVYSSLEDRKSVLENFQNTHDSYEVDVTCPICRDIYQTPRFLRCYHSFCEECIEGLYRTHFPRPVITCPFKCKLKTVMIHGNQGVKSLPVDHFKTRIVEERAKLIHLNEFVITENNENSDGMDCSGGKNCEKAKTGGDISESYEIHSADSYEDQIEVGSIPETVIDTCSESISSSNIEYCTIHTETGITKFCSTCQTPVCVSCVPEFHETHEIVKIEDAISLYKTKLEILKSDVEKSYALLKPEHEKMLNDLHADVERLKSASSKAELEKTQLNQISSFLEQKIRLTKYKLSGDVVKECTGIVNSVLDIEADGSRNNKSRNNQNSTGSGTSSSGYSSKKNYCKSVFVKHAIQAEQEIDTLLRDLTSVESPATERRRLRRDSDKSEFSRYEKLDEIEVKIIENQTEMVNEIGKAIKAYEPKNEVQTAECHEEAYAPSMYSRLRDTIPSNKVTMKDITLVLMLVYIAVLHFGHKTSDTSGHHANSAVEHVFVPEPMMLLDFNNKMEAETVKIKNAYETVENEAGNNGDRENDRESAETDNFSDQENFDDETTFGRDFSKTTHNLKPTLDNSIEQPCMNKRSTRVNTNQVNHKPEHTSKSFSSVWERPVYIPVL